MNRDTKNSLNQYSGTFDEERFNNENKSMIYSGVSNWKEMESVIPGFHHTDKVGDETFLGLSWADNLECLAPTRSQVLISLGENTAAEGLNAPWKMAMEGVSGKVGTVITWQQRLGGPASMAFSAIDVIQDLGSYSAGNLRRALLYDTFPIIDGIIGGQAGVEIGIIGAGTMGAILGSTAGDLLKLSSKDKISTDKQMENMGQGKGVDKK